MRRGGGGRAPPNGGRIASVAPRLSIFAKSIRDCLLTSVISNRYGCEIASRPLMSTTSNGAGSSGSRSNGKRRRLPGKPTRCSPGWASPKRTSRACCPRATPPPAQRAARPGDLTLLPLAVITDAQQAVGATALTRVAAGLPLRQDLLKSAASVSIGQTVRVVASGQGFTISAEGSVLNNAAPGQQVRVRMAAGQIVTAIVKDAATVEIPL